MIDLSTGKSMTRREAVKGLAGLAGIIAAGKAPAAVVRSMLGARGVAFGKEPLLYDAEVNYLESVNGNCYIDTGIICDDSTGFSVDVMPYLSGRVNARIIGSYCGSNGRFAFVFREHEEYKSFYYGWNNASRDFQDSSALMNNRFTASLNYLNDRKFKCGSVKENLAQTLYSPQLYTSILFGNNINGSINISDCFIGRIYGCVMTRGTSVIRDFHPVIKNVNGVNVSFMHDRVTNALFGNVSGQGAFTWG